jgi:hypothetical protein
MVSNLKLYGLVKVLSFEAILLVECVELDVVLDALMFLTSFLKKKSKVSS